MADAGLIVLVSMISPFAAERQRARELIGSEDVKGLYGKARTGELTNCTGVDSPSEAPRFPDIRIDTTQVVVGEAADQVVEHLREEGTFIQEREPEWRPGRRRATGGGESCRGYIVGSRLDGNADPPPRGPRASNRSAHCPRPVARSRSRYQPTSTLECQGPPSWRTDHMGSMPWEERLMASSFHSWRRRRACWTTSGETGARSCCS